MYALLIAITLLAGLIPAAARDPEGKYANSKLHEWFQHLQSGKGPCCADADGALMADADWESKDGHYRVRIEGQWIDVPDAAVIKEPNLDGRTIVWGYATRGWGGMQKDNYIIRCFMPGSMG